MNERYENRLPPEGINVSKAHPLLEFLSLLGGFALLIVALVGALYLAGEVMGRHLPLRWEMALASKLPPAEDPQSKALQAIVERLAAKATLPEGMTFSVKYVDDDEINAYASFGGRIFMHKGLLTQLHSENAVAMVLGHEMAHIIHRDPARSMGGRLLVAGVLSVVGSALGTDGLTSLVNGTSNLTLLTFSREDERRADALGAELLAKAYGHLGGAREVFTALAAVEAKIPVSIPEFLSTHPDTAHRVKLFAELAREHNVAEDGKVTPLPKVLRSEAK